MLNRRDYGAGELRQALVARGFDGPTAETTVARLASEKLVDDARFAEHFVAYHAQRGQGPVRIAHRLREAGVAGETVAAAIDAGDADWRRLCAETRKKRFGANLPATWAERGRQARFLSQRGFSAEQIRAAVGGAVDED